MWYRNYQKEKINDICMNIQSTVVGTSGSKPNSSTGMTN